MSLPICTVSRACAPAAARGVVRWTSDSITRGLLAMIFCVAVIFPASAQEPAASGAGFDVERYTLRLQPDIDAGTLFGDQRIFARVLADGLSTAVFDAGDLVVRSVYRDGAAIAFEREGRQLRIRLPSPAHAGQRLDLRVVYDGKPRYGLRKPRTPTIPKAPGLRSVICPESSRFGLFRKSGCPVLFQVSRAVRPVLFVLFVLFVLLSRAVACCCWPCAGNRLTCVGGSRT